MEVTDWDYTLHVLTGLPLDVTPANARRAYDLRLFEKYPDGKVQHDLKTIATHLYNHRKMTPMFAARVSDGSNTLAYLLCACYEESSSPESGVALRLRRSVPLPLAEWDRLYYVIVAEIRKTYSSLQEAFGQRFERGATILHDSGRDGASGSTSNPVSAVNLASLLEAMMAGVTDHRLLSALDLAVRMRNAGERDSEDESQGDSDVELDEDDEFWKSEPGSHVHTHTERCPSVATAEGLIDINDMTPDEIIGMAWSQQAEESRRESVIRGEDETLLARSRAEVREGSPYATKDSQLSAIIAAYCTCGPDCYCRDVCDLEGNECNCAFVRGQMREMVGEQREVQEAVHAKSGPTGAHLPNNMLGAITNDVAQMQVAAVAQPDPHMMQACYATKEAADKLDRRTLQQHRRRADTAESELAYVPAYVPAPRTPSRGKKDAYPLGFYGESSGQRYPPFRSNVTKNAPPPVYGASFYNAQMPVRKPVPRNFSRPDTSSSPPAESPPGQVVYPSFPASKSQNYFAHSFPVAAKGNPRVPASDDDDNNDDVAGPTEETHDTIRHFSDEPEMYAPNIPNSSATQLARPPTRSNIVTATTPPTGSLGLPRSRTKTFLGLSKPAQPLLTLPEPDFNHPKPAVKQRYVSAGGTTKLDERQEIAGPAFAGPAAAQGHAPAMPKAELFERVKDPEFVRAHFGEEAVAKMGSLETSPGKAGHGGSGLLRQHPSGIDPAAGKRERTESNTSSRSAGRFSATLRRVFGRKNSGCD